MQFKHKVSYFALGGVFVIVGLLGMTSISLAQGDPWTAKAPMLTARGILSTSVVDGIIYAIGGGTGVYSNLPTVEAYDPATDTWTTRAPMPTPRAALSTCVVDGIIYAIGGGWSPALSTVEAYDPVTDAWTTKTPMLTPRMGLSTSVVDEIIYAIGGCPDAQMATGLTTVEAYDPKTDTWTKKAEMPTARVVLSTSVVDGIIYAIGGAGKWAPGLSALRTVEAYDPATNTWTDKADMPTLRGALSTSVVDGMIYAIGGAASYYGALPTVEAYDPVTNIWTTKTDMPSPRRFLSSSAVDGKIYAIGGFDGGGQVLATVEEYAPSSDLTSVEERSGATAVPSGYALSQNYPNPFNPSTRIEFSVPHSSYVTLKVFSLLGEEVATLASQNLAVGSYRVDWNARGVASGVYLYRLQAGLFSETRKLILLR
jgi:N-acetylneuraminic acid mutarotase